MSEWACDGSTNRLVRKLLGVKLGIRLRVNEPCLKHILRFRHSVSNEGTAAADPAELEKFFRSLFWQKMSRIGSLAPNSCQYTFFSSHSNRSIWYSCSCNLRRQWQPRHVYYFFILGGNYNGREKSRSMIAWNELRATYFLQNSTTLIDIYGFLRECTKRIDKLQQKCRRNYSEQTEAASEFAVRMNFSIYWLHFLAQTSWLKLHSKGRRLTDNEMDGELWSSKYYNLLFSHTRRRCDFWFKNKIHIQAAQS